VTERRHRGIGRDVVVAVSLVVLLSAGSDVRFAVLLGAGTTVEAGEATTSLGETWSVQAQGLSVLHGPGLLGVVVDLWPATHRPWRTKVQIRWTRKGWDGIPQPPRGRKSCGTLRRGIHSLGRWRMTRRIASCADGGRCGGEVFHGQPSRTPTGSSHADGGQTTGVFDRCHSTRVISVHNLR
jgi:hypothetical protein